MICCIPFLNHNSICRHSVILYFGYIAQKITLDLIAHTQEEMAMADTGLENRQSWIEGAYEQMDKRIKLMEDLYHPKNS